jgi:hypothetical protein
MFNFKEWGLLFGVFAAWVVLSRWVLPLFGVNTCMSGACPVSPPPAVTEEVSVPADAQREVP